MNDIERPITDINKVWQAGFRAGVEAGAKVCDEHSKKASTNISAVLSCVGAIIRSLLNESVDAKPPDQVNRPINQESQL